MAIFKVSQSKVKLWRRCRYAYSLKYVEKLRPKAKGRPLEFGTIIHSMLEAEAEGTDPFKVLDDMSPEKLKIFAGEKDTYGQILRDARVIMSEYFRYYKDDSSRPIKVNGKRSEHEFQVMVDDGIQLTMKVDEFTKAEGMRWLKEHKTAKSIPDSGSRWRDLQTSIYIRACELLGMKKFDGICWNYIRSKSPTKPKQNKNGQLSQKKIDTLPLAVVETLTELKIPRSTAKKLIEVAEENRSSYFSRFYTAINPEITDVIFKDFINTSREMVKLHGKSKERNIDRHCEWCEYDKICRADLTGADVDFVKEREYETSTKPA